MVDAAIERLANEHLARQRGSFEPEQDGEHEHELDLALYEAPASRPRKPTRLRWKGLDVSDEFRSYAERVARGEDLPPFEGRVLAEPNPAFPWDQEAATTDPPKRAGRGPGVILWSSAALVLALLGWSISKRLEGPALATVGEDPSASSMSSSASASVAATPHDVVEPGVVGADTVEPGGVTSATLALEPQAAPGATDPVPETPAIAAAPAESADRSASDAPSTVTPVATGATTAAVPLASSAPPAAVPARVAPPGALEQAISAVFAARAAETGTAESQPGGATAREDDFGVLPPGNAVPVASIAASSTAAAAKSAPPVVGNVGDLAGVRPPSPGAVRKEPGTESSAKGSLLVEVPSF